MAQIRSLQVELDNLTAEQVEDQKEVDIEKSRIKSQLQASKLRLESEMQSKQRRLSLLNMSLEYGLYPTEADLSTLQEFFPEVNIRKLYEVEKYHQKLAAILDEQFTAERQSVEEEIANLQDLLIFQIKGISCYGKVLQDEGQHIDKNIIRFIENVLFTTLTNVNFDSKVHVELLNESQRIKENLRTITGELHNQTSYATYDLPETKTQMLKDAQFAGIMYDKSLDPDIRSLRQTILYGLKGISAYGHQARELGYYSDEVDEFLYSGIGSSHRR